MVCVLSTFGVACHLIVDGPGKGNKGRTAWKEPTMDEYLILLPDEEEAHDTG